MLSKLLLLAVYLLLATENGSNAQAEENLPDFVSSAERPKQFHLRDDLGETYVSWATKQLSSMGGVPPEFLTRDWMAKEQDYGQVAEIILNLAMKDAQRFESQTCVKVLIVTGSIDHFHYWASEYHSMAQTVYKVLLRAVLLNPIDLSYTTPMSFVADNLEGKLYSGPLQKFTDGVKQMLGTNSVFWPGVYTSYLAPSEELYYPEEYTSVRKVILRAGYNIHSSLAYFEQFNADLTCESISSRFVNIATSLGNTFRDQINSILINATLFAETVSDVTDPKVLDYLREALLEHRGQLEKFIEPLEALEIDPNDVTAPLNQITLKALQISLELQASSLKTEETASAILIKLHRRMGVDFDAVNQGQLTETEMTQFMVFLWQELEFHATENLYYKQMAMITGLLEVKRLSFSTYTSAMWNTENHLATLLQRMNPDFGNRTLAKLSIDQYLTGIFLENMWEMEEEIKYLMGYMDDAIFLPYSVLHRAVTYTDFGASGPLVRQIIKMALHAISSNHWEAGRKYLHRTSVAHCIKIFIDRFENPNLEEEINQFYAFFCAPLTQDGVKLEDIKIHISQELAKLYKVVVPNMFADLRRYVLVLENVESYKVRAGCLGDGFAALFQRHLWVSFANGGQLYEVPIHPGV